MRDHAWVDEFPGAITVCDKNGVILEMNGKASKTFEKDGGRELIGKNVLDCHPEPSRTKLKEIMASGNRNVYTIEKEGIKKLIYQSPWYKGGEYCGVVEISLEIPSEMPNFHRD